MTRPADGPTSSGFGVAARGEAGNGAPIDGRDLTTAPNPDLSQDQQARDGGSDHAAIVAAARRVTSSMTKVEAGPGCYRITFPDSDAWMALVLALFNAEHKP